MLNSKVIDIIKSFSHDEMKRFGEFMNSPFHNKNKKATMLFDLLSKYHPDYDNENLTKENLFAKIFRTEKFFYNDASIRNLLSDLMILSEKFLSYLSFEKDKFEVMEKCLKELSERKLPLVFEKKLNSAEALLNDKEFENETQYFKKFVLEELKSSSIQFSDDLKLYKDDSLIKSTDYLTYFYLIKIFKVINYIGFRKQYNIDSSMHIAEKILAQLNIKEILSSVKDISKKDYQIFFVYFNMYKTLSDPLNYESYFEFKKTLLEYDNLFVPLEKYGLYVFLSNSCVQKIDNGNEKFFKECFEIYGIMFDKKIFDVYPGYLAMTTFTSVLITGLAAGEFEKVEKFVLQYSEKLNPEHKKDGINYANSQLHFYKKNYGKALECIIKTDTEFSSFKYHLKITSLKIFYETGDYDSLYYTSDAFTHFINKNKMVGSTYKEEFRNFIKILDLMVKHKLKKDKEYVDKIKMLLDNNKIASKRWLLEKFGELIQNK